MKVYAFNEPITEIDKKNAGILESPKRKKIKSY